MMYNQTLDKIRTFEAMQIYLLYQHREADEDVASAKESQFQNKVKHGHQNKISPTKSKEKR